VPFREKGHEIFRIPDFVDPVSGRMPTMRNLHPGSTSDEAGVDAEFRWYKTREFPAEKNEGRPNPGGPVCAG